MGVDCGNKYVTELNRNPQTFCKHLRPAQGHPASQFLPGLLGYDGYCQEQNRIVNETIPKLKSEIQANKGTARIAAGLLRVAQLKTRTFYDSVFSREAVENRRRAEAEATENRHRAQVTARKERVYFAASLYTKVYNTELYPVPQQLIEFVKTKAFRERTRGHPAFTEKITEKDIWKYNSPSIWKYKST